MSTITKKDYAENAGERKDDDANKLQTRNLVIKGNPFCSLFFARSQLQNTKVRAYI